MKEREKRLAHAVLVEMLGYNAVTGQFIWKKPTSNRVKIGDVAGQINHQGHRLISVNGTRYAAHRLAWFYVKGVWPSEEIDHINLVKDDNRLSNLREATRNGNCRNVGKKKHNRSGFKGVHRHSLSPNRFVAQITVDGRPKYLGLFGTPEEAHAAYVKASDFYHGEFGRAE
jgi:hypothetical protein